MQPPRTDNQAAGRRGDQVGRTPAGEEPGQQRGTRVLTGWVVIFLLLTGVLSFIALYWPVR